ncbi:hypothetical protein [Rickettsia asembonensis]|uniref:hypothetical protein n=1 Tax=Rickettsia asembonensis TaxID=1068590 RepID=UPI000B1BCBE3|nr:hypothetical protein [Rickettsia asembonensis]
MEIGHTDHAYHVEAIYGYFLLDPAKVHGMTERGTTESFHATKPMPRGNDIEAMKQDR